MYAQDAGSEILHMEWRRIVVSEIICDSYAGGRRRARSAHAGWCCTHAREYVGVREVRLHACTRGMVLHARAVGLWRAGNEIACMHARDGVARTRGWA